MATTHDTPFSRFMDGLPGWLCLIGGAVLLGLFTLTPQWLACREVAWHRDLMRLQAASLDAQRQRYEQFHHALAEDDPVVIERLAFAELRQKPAGQELFDPDPGVLLAYHGQMIPDEGLVGDVSGVAGAAPPLSAPGSIHDWLEVPNPVVGRDIAPLPRIESHLTRITTGPFRLIAVVAAVGVMAMGVLFQVRTRSASQRA
ncbi:MAG: hypothetical protein GVY24_07940 [Planctomycetes bacterium]|nr:hypothetical protein [Planctomycetota bacterium]